MNIVTDLKKEKQVIKIANNAIHDNKVFKELIVISLISYFNWLFRGVKCMNVRKLDIMLKDSNNKPIPDGSAKSCQGGKSMKLFKSFRCNSLGHSGR